MSLTVDERKTLTEFWCDICKEKNQFLMVQVGGAPLKSVIDMVSGKKFNIVILFLQENIH